MKPISKLQVIAQYESIYAEAVLKMQADGLFMQQVKSHTNGKDVIIRVHPAFNVFKEAATALAVYNGWNKETAQLELNLDY